MVDSRSKANRIFIAITAASGTGRRSSTFMIPASMSIPAATRATKTIAVIVSVAVGHFTSYAVHHIIPTAFPTNGFPLTFHHYSLELAPVGKLLLAPILFNLVKISPFTRSDGLRELVSIFPGLTRARRGDLPPLFQVAAVHELGRGRVELH